MSLINCPLIPLAHSLWSPFTIPTSYTGWLVNVPLTSEQGLKSLPSLTMVQIWPSECQAQLTTPSSLNQDPRLPFWSLSFWLTSRPAAEMNVFFPPWSLMSSYSQKVAIELVFPGFCPNCAIQPEPPRLMSPNHTCRLQDEREKHSSLPSTSQSLCFQILSKCQSFSLCCLHG